MIYMSKVQWIKIDTEIIHNRKIQALRYEKNGNDMILLWFYLLVLAGKTNDNGQIYFTNTIPYDAEKLSKEFIIKKPNVLAALKYFKDNEMISVLENGVITVENWEEYQNYQQLERIKEGNRLRQKRYYDNHKNNAQPNAVLTPTDMLANGIDKNRIEKIRIEENRPEEKREESLINNKRENDFIEELNNEPTETLYGFFTDRLLAENILISTDAYNHHKKIEAYFKPMEKHTFERFVRSFKEKRVTSAYILKMVGINL
jgi:predicted phage replisome organizer